MYGRKSEEISRQALHSYMMTFNHPISKEKIVITAPLLEDFKKVIDTSF